jgi:hypothetical protein
MIFKNSLVAFPLSCYTEGGFDEQTIALEWLLALFFSKKVKKVSKCKEAPANVSTS